MIASKREIETWFDEGVASGATHMVIVCDTFDHTDYPVFVASAEAARKKADHPGEMQRTMEVYCLSADKAEQMALLRCFRF